MPGRKVEAVEVVADGLDLPTVDHLVAETEEDRLDLPTDLRDQVAVAPGDRLARERDVEDILGQRAIQGGSLERRTPLGDRSLEDLAETVQPFARVAVANLPERLLQVAPATEEANAGIVQLGQRRGAGNRA